LTAINWYLNLNISLYIFTLQKLVALIIICYCNYCAFLERGNLFCKYSYQCFIINRLKYTEILYQNLLWEQYAQQLDLIIDILNEHRVTSKN
jgi:hypothetical protein